MKVPFISAKHMFPLSHFLLLYMTKVTIILVYCDNIQLQYDEYHKSLFKPLLDLTSSSVADSLSAVLNIAIQRLKGTPIKQVSSETMSLEINMVFVHRMLLFNISCY